MPIFSVCTAHVRFSDVKATSFSAGSIPLESLEILINLVIIVRCDMGDTSGPVLLEKSMPTEAHVCPVSLSYP